MQGNALAPLAAAVVRETELANEQAALDACIRVLEVVSDLRGVARDDAQTQGSSA